MDFFKDLYTNSRNTRHLLHGVEFKFIDDSQKDWLERPITEEVKNAIWNFEIDKSLGPDGFFMAFFKACWEILKGDILKMVEGLLCIGISR